MDGSEVSIGALDVDGDSDASCGVMGAVEGELVSFGAAVVKSASGVEDDTVAFSVVGFGSSEVDEISGANDGNADVLDVSGVVVS